MCPIDDLPGAMTVPTRDGERDRFRRDYSFHDPASETTEGTQPWIEASTMADAVMPVYHDVKLVADATDPEKIGGALLTVQAESMGVFRPVAVGGSGSVTIGASGGGGTIFAGDQLTALGLTFACSVTNLYFNGDAVPIQGVDTGPATNLPAGTVMTWTSPRPGITATATVFAQLDGSGLSGGRDEATDEEYRKLWNEAKQSRAASGNDGEIQELAETTAGIAVEKAFTVPGCLGPATTCVMFTLKPSTVTSSRLPNPTQVAAVLANVVGSMPADEGIFGALLSSQPVDCTFKVTWDPNGVGWADITTWPAYYSILTQGIIVNAATDATHFILQTSNSVYTSVVNPLPGQTIGFYDQPFGTFRRKRILTVVGTGPWTIVVDASNGTSDESYTPIAGQRACPWSESLQDLVAPVAATFQALGPGEQFASFFSPGQRQRRSPLSPRSWPNVLTTKRLEESFDATNSVFDVTIAEPTLPLVTTIGTPGVSSNLMELAYLSAFPL
jgi:uncharacterized phage protein gp47/JayE